MGNNVNCGECNVPPFGGVRDIGWKMLLLPWQWIGEKVFYFPMQWIGYNL